MKKQLLVFAVGWLVTGALSAHAQSVTTIYTFTNGSSGPGPANPAAALTLGPDGNFYGTSLHGGGFSGYGTLFKVTTNGLLTTLTNFNLVNLGNGASPYGGLTLGPDGNFYGTAANGGNNNQGTVFQATPDGTLTTLVKFNNTNGAGPMAGLALGPEGNLYGTTWGGGTNGYGTVFRVTFSGTLTTLASFSGSNGGNPDASLTLGPDGNFYGTTHLGFNNEYGTVFQVTTNGALTTLFGFNLTNGAGPDASLTLGPDGNFYGTTHAGGSSGSGTVFRMTTNGTLTTLVNFDNNTNGGSPYAGLALGPDGSFYGTTRQAGSGGYGTVFKMAANGTLKTLASFYGTNGANPWAALTLGLDGNFYGTTYGGGSGGGGTIFQLELPPDFITSPTNQSILVGGTATFNCQPFGTAPFAYQWLSNGNTIAGATNSSLAVTYASWLANTNAQFQVVVTNNWGNITSSMAVINLFPPGYGPPAITPIYSFSTNGNYGSHLKKGLTLGLDGNFYGTTTLPGSDNNATIFKVTTNGIMTKLAGAIGSSGLTLGPDGNFYGDGDNFVFKLTPDGTVTTFVISIYSPVGRPSSDLTLGPDGNFYGVAEIGYGDCGGVFKVTTNGTVTLFAGFYINGDCLSGAWPWGTLTLGPAGNFYGTANGSAMGNSGAIFQLTPNGALPILATNMFFAALTFGSDGYFYGTTLNSVFKMTTNGTVTTLVSSNFYSGDVPFSAGLTLGPDGNFYGTTSRGGITNGYNYGRGCGTVFKVTTNGTLTTLASFDGVNGAAPESSLTLGPDGNFYGTTSGGGSGGGGTIFRLNLPPDFIAGPASQSIFIGGAVTLTCQPFGTGPFAYQWLSNGIPITGATGSSFAVTYASWLADNNAQFQVVVANNWGSITSSVAVIHLAPLNYSLSTITSVYSFTAGSDGAHPYAGLTLGPDGNFYGTAWTGGTGGYGTAFRFTTNSTLTTLVDFNYANGAYPVEDLTLGPDDKLYGTTADGGSGSSGTVFTLTTNGTLTTLVNFNGSANGADPRGDLMLAPDGNFYGTTANGGSSSDGTVFKMTSAGTLTPLASFNFTNGAYPFSGLTLGPEGNFYGTTYLGGNDNGSGSGTVFKMTVAGMLATLVSFNNTNGAYPFADLTLGPDGSFYGTTWQGGDASLNNGSGVGTVFKVSSNGTLTTLIKFANTNGAHPFARLTFGPDGLLYGTTSGGGANGFGTVFRMTTNGALTVLASFNNSNGANPWTGLTLGADGNFYGTTYAGGSAGIGTIYRLDLPPDLITSPANQSAVPGGAVTFNCLPFGTGPFAYQWLSNGVPVVGATSNSLTVSYASWLANTNAQFQVVVANNFGSILSSAVSVVVPPVIMTIFSFNSDGSDGVNPFDGLTLGPDGNLYGTTYEGGDNPRDYGHEGVIFRVSTNGMFTKLVSFNGNNGANPLAGLALGPDGNFYGTTATGGNTNLNRGNGWGTVFKVTTNGVLTTLVNFAITNGVGPRGNLTLGPDGNFYGTTSGTVFKMSPNGTLTNLANLGPLNYPNFAGLTIGPDGNFYGTTDGDGGPLGGNWGSAFQVTTNGMLTTLFARYIANDTNGTILLAGLTLGPDGNLYGAASAGGWGSGSIFKITTSGTFTPLVIFDGSNGAAPEATLTLGPDGNFYGTTTTSAAGSAGVYGTVFRMTPSGTLTTLASFNYTNNGAYPKESLTLGPDGNFYGMTPTGGSGGNGTIYRLNLPPDFIRNPASQMIGPGASATFDCQPFGTGPFSYQWLSNGIPIAGATGSSLTLSNISWQITGAQFQVVITNNWGSILSSAASVHVLLQPTISAVSFSGNGHVTVQLGSYPNSTNRLWATTNLALPLSQWHVVATNITDSNGLSQFHDTNIIGLPTKFYRLSSP